MDEFKDNAEVILLILEILAAASIATYMLIAICASGHALAAFAVVAIILGVIITATNDDTDVA